MDSKKTHTLSKATVATVVAASGVLVAMPQPSNAATFSDLNPYADYYEPVIDLVNRNIATGYPDGTFKPNQAITRADAAKMLALAIDVNIANPKNPGFKDVNVNNGNYRYIAALAEAGIINGFTDNTFKPNEPITRGQMAKIITLGFQFGMSSKLNNSFRDVSPTNFAAYYIQTLVDLNVTKGTTTVTFDPFKNVTRAQMASFVWRAEKADRGTPIYTVGDVSGNTIYINGVAHTVASHLRSVINVSNKNILKGAYIEGTFANNTLTNITKLTLNASGSSSRLLALDGNYTSFAGELVINGSYVRLKNLNFTGRVEVAETPRRSLAALQNVRIASVGNLANFIDWEQPTESKNDDFLNPIDNETLKDKTNNSTKPTSKYKDRMANIQKYVDFEGSDIRNLVVTGDRAFIKGDSVIDRLTVRGDVTNFELYADAKAMYLDNDYNMTVYGVHDIQYVYKNALKNVKFNTDSTYDYYYVTTKSGYTDLGEFAYINDAIIPKGTTVNTNFDDFDTDEPNIGYIEDENGTPVSRDPVGDTIIADLSAPKITQLDVKAGGTIADGTITVDEDGMYYYVIKKAKEKAPTISEIKTGGVPLSGNGPVLMDEKAPFQATGLETKTEYVLYAIAIDGSDNVSEKKSVKFSTIDSSPPMLKLESGEKMYGGKRLQFKLTPSEEGKIYYYIRPDSSAPKPTVDDVIEKQTATLDAKEPGTIIETAFKHGIKPNLDDILPNTPYQIFAVMVDKSGNKMRLVEEIKITTESPDTKQPYVEDATLTVVEPAVNGIFEFRISEALDLTTAKDPKNYTLSGTGIINISGQKEINPSHVEIDNVKKTVRLTIPSISALVKGDTIRVSVSKNVKDLAENEFEHEGKFDTTIANNPRNIAYYTHEDILKPKLDIINLIKEQNLNKVEVYAHKAGTYYYMILEDSYDFKGKGIAPRDFVDEFNADIAAKTTKFGVPNFKDYTGNLLKQYGTAEFGLNTLPLIITPENLNPFKSYSLYMVLKDRAGLIAENIESIKLVMDSKAPLVHGMNVKATEDSNSSVTFNFKSDEAGRLHAIPVKKYLYDSTKDEYKLNSTYFYNDGTLKAIPNVFPATSSDEQRRIFEDFAAQVGSAIKTDSFEKGEAKAVITGLNEHEEYGFYIAVEDNTGVKGNYTIFARKDAADPAAPEEPNGDPLLGYAYTDGIKPSIEGSQIIYRSPEPDDKEFTITFNESIMRQKAENNTNSVKYNKSIFESLTVNADLPDLFEVYLGNMNSTTGVVTTTGSNIASEYKFVSYTVGSKTTEPTKLVIRPKDDNKADRTIVIKMKDDISEAYDYVGRNKFDISKIGRFVDPAQKLNKVHGPVLSGTLIDLGTTYSSKSITLGIEISTTSAKTIYYAVLNSGNTKPSAKDILYKWNNPTSTAVPGLTMVGKFETNGGTSLTPTFNASETTDASGSFMSGQILYLFTLDQYGNIVWADPATIN